MVANWQYKIIADMCSVLTDGNWIESKDQSPDGIRLIQTGNIGNGVFKDKGDKARYISEETFERLSCTEIFEGDVLVSRLPEPIGRSCILPKLEQRTVTAVDCSILRFKKDLLNKFFVYFTLSPAYDRALKNYITGSSRKRISRSNLGLIKVPVPPIEEQQRIVDELDLLTGIIDKKNAQLRDLDALAQSIFYEMFGNPETLRLKNTLGEACSIVGRIGFRGYTRDDFVDGPEDGAISLSPANIINSEMNYDKCSYITWEKYDESPEIMIEDGDILVVKTGSSYGKTALVEGLPHKATINPQFVVLKQLSVDNEYLTAYLSTPFARRKYEEYVIGTAIPTFSQKKLASMPLLIPSTADQKRFSSAMSGIRNERRLIKQALEDNKSLLNSRMDFYFTD